MKSGEDHSSATIKKNKGTPVFEADNYNEGRISQYYTVDLQMLWIRNKAYATVPQNLRLILTKQSVVLHISYRSAATFDRAFKYTECQFIDIQFCLCTIRKNAYRRCMPKVQVTHYRQIRAAVFVTYEQTDAFCIGIKICGAFHFSYFT